MSSKTCSFLIGWDVHNALTAKTQSVPLRDVLQHHISVFLHWDLLDPSECKRTSPSKSSSLSLFLLVKETDCWPLGWYKVGRWEGSMAAAQRMGCSYLNMLPNAAGQKPSVYPLLFFLSSSLSEVSAKYLARMATYNHSNPIWHWGELGNKNQELSTSWQCAVGRKEQFEVAVHQ